MSDKNLDQLIASLKTEAIEVAETESKKILEAAKLKAKEIEESAEKKRLQIIKDAEKEASDIVSKGKIVLQLAARDLKLSLRNDLINLFKIAFEKEVRKGFKPDLIKSVISSVIQNVGTNVEIDLPTETVLEIGDYLHNQIQMNGKHVVINQDDGLPAGMKITKTDEGWSYDITSESITEALLPYLTSNWMDILKKEE